MPFLLSLMPIASAVLSRLALLAILLLCARNLPADEFGIFGLSTTVMAVFSGFVSGGDMVLNRFTRAHFSASTSTALWLAYLGAVLLTSLAALLPASIFAYAIGLGGDHTITLLLTLAGGIVFGWGECIFAIIRAQGRVRVFFLLRDILPSVASLIVFGLLRPDTANAALAWFLLFPAAALLGAGLILQPWSWWTLRGRAMHIARLIGRHHFSLALGNLSIRLYVYIDVLILAAFAPLAMVGQYRLAAQLAVGFWIVQHFAFLGLPWQMRQRGNPAADLAVAQRQRLLVALTFLAIAASWPVLGFLLPFIGPDYSGAAALFFILLAIRATDLLWGPQHELMVSNRMTREDLLSSTAAILTWVAVFLPLTYLRADHLRDALTSTLAAATLGHLVRWHLLRRGGVMVPYGQPLGVVLPLLAALTILAAIRMLP